MSEFFFRTEEIEFNELAQLFSETEKDREIIDLLKGRNTVLLVGSRGAGKSFLLRYAEYELVENFSEFKIFPVYISFMKSALLRTNDRLQFHNWMLCSIVVNTHKALMKRGVLAKYSSHSAYLTKMCGESNRLDRISELVQRYESSYLNPSITISEDLIPKIEEVKELFDELCEECKIKRFVLMFDECAHALIPEQQRQFYTLFRDLKASNISCKAAVYPGITSYGETFQPAHDAVSISINRDVTSDNYIDSMKAIVTKQSDSALLANITKNGQNFATLAYASNGNPRILLKTIAKSGKLSSKEVNATISSFYRETAWQEYTQLGDSYPGLKTFIDWGRNFIENWVISDLLKKNDAYLADDKKTTCFFWIHKDAPQQVKESLRLLEYSGIVAEHSKAVKATRSEVGNRYLVSLGHIMAFLPYPSKTGFDIAKNLTVKRMAEFGLSHLAYKSISESPIIQADLSIEALRIQLQKPVDQLELSNFQIHKIQELGIVSIEDLLRSDVSDLKKAKFIGDKRAARIQNSAIAALFEYLAG